MDPSTVPEPAPGPPDPPSPVEAAVVLGILLVGATSCYLFYHQLIGEMLRQIWRFILGRA